MWYVVIIAVILGLIFGFSVGANFFALVLLMGMFGGFIGSIALAIDDFRKNQYSGTILHILGAVFWGWILSICFF